jgi:hypothetical protein
MELKEQKEIKEPKAKLEIQVLRVIQVPKEIKEQLELE